MSTIPVRLWPLTRKRPQHRLPAMTCILPSIRICRLPLTIFWNRRLQVFYWIKSRTLRNTPEKQTPARNSTFRYMMCILPCLTTVWSIFPIWQVKMPGSRSSMCTKNIFPTRKMYTAGSGKNWRKSLRLTISFPRNIRFTKAILWNI